MSTSVRIVVHCDEHASGAQCHGFWEASERQQLGNVGARYDLSMTRLAEAGWLRGYRGDDSLQTYDACPACAPIVQARIDRQVAETAPQASIEEVEPHG